MQHLQHLVPFESLCADAPEEEALPPVPTDLNIKSGIFTDHPWDIWHWLVLDVLSFSLTELDPSVFVLTHSNLSNNETVDVCSVSTRRSFQPLTLQDSGSSAAQC